MVSDTNGGDSFLTAIFFQRKAVLPFPKYTITLIYRYTSIAFPSLASLLLASEGSSSPFSNFYLLSSF
jgi:hypothetical protein